MGAVAFLEKIEARHLNLSEDEFRRAKLGEFVPVPRMSKRKAKRRPTGGEADLGSKPSKDGDDGPKEESDSGNCPSEGT